MRARSRGLGARHAFDNGRHEFFIAGGVPVQRLAQMRQRPVGHHRRAAVLDGVQQFDNVAAAKVVDRLAAQPRPHINPEAALDLVARCAGSARIAGEESSSTPSTVYARACRRLAPPPRRCRRAAVLDLASSLQRLVAGLIRRDVASSPSPTQCCLPAPCGGSGSRRSRRRLQSSRHKADRITIGNDLARLSRSTADLLIFCRMVPPVCARAHIWAISGKHKETRWQPGNGRKRLFYRCFRRLWQKSRAFKNLAAIAKYNS